MFVCFNFRTVFFLRLRISCYNFIRVIFFDGPFTFLADLQTSFRGYPLEGTTVVVPEGYKGITFFEYKKPDAEGVERNLHSTGIFTQFTYWNYDKIPSKNDAFVAALDWIDIAEAVRFVCLLRNNKMASNERYWLKICVLSFSAPLHLD